MLWWTVKIACLIVVLWLTLRQTIGIARWTATLLGVQYSPSAKKTFDGPSELSISTSATIKIVYVDYHGRRTKRIVHVKVFDSLQGWVIGYCTKRKAERHFRLDRIESALDMATSQKIQNLAEFLLERDPIRIAQETRRKANKKICADWDTNPARWASAAAAARHYASQPEFSEYSPQIIATWIRLHKKAIANISRLE